MNKIIFDTETTGLPTKWNAADKDIDVQTRIVKFDLIVINEKDYILFEKIYY